MILTKLKSGRTILGWLRRRTNLSLEKRRLVVKLWITFIYSQEVIWRKIVAVYSGRNWEMPGFQKYGFCFLSEFRQEFDPAIEQAKKIFKQEIETDCNSLDAYFSSVSAKSGKSHRRDLLDGLSIDAYREIFNLAASPTLVGIATNYLGAHPVLARLELWITNENDELAGEQLFHFDKEDTRQARFFLNVSDVENENGPFTFLPATFLEKQFRNISNPWVRISDEEVYGLGGREEQETLEGESGTAAFVDTCRCLHFGSRTRRGYRLVLVFWYLNRNPIMEQGFQNVPKKSQMKALTYSQRLLLVE